jgi:hypothetical protein
MEIELTSRLDDQQWSWRAAGARQPKGTLEASLLPAGASVGDIVRAEVETSLDGIEVTMIVKPAATAKPEKQVETIELIGSGRSQASGVSWNLSKKPKKDGRRPRRDAERGERPPGQGRPGPPRSGRPGSPRNGRPAAGRPSGPVLTTEHRNALLATLESAQLPIAEQLLLGGIPAVRAAIQEQNTIARNSKQPEVSSDAIMAIAEKLLPLTNLAMWKDRATTAQNGGKDTRVRDLRAVVSASRSVNLDEEGKTLAKSLREALEQRSKALSEEWEARIKSSLDSGNVAEALRIASKPPEHSTRLPGELAKSLADAASAGLTADLSVTEWKGLLAAVVESPVRRSVKPGGIPSDAEAQAEAMKSAGAVPALAKLLGLPIPPPPPRQAPQRRTSRAS